MKTKKLSIDFTKDQKVKIKNVDPAGIEYIKNELLEINAWFKEKINGLPLETKLKYFIMEQILNKTIVPAIKKSTTFTLTKPEAIIFIRQFSFSKYVGTESHRIASQLHQKLI